MGDKGVNIIKETNLDHLRRTLRVLRTATKPQLSELMGISVVTVNSLIKDLLDSGEVLENNIEKSQLGRPALAYRFNAEYSLALVIYMHEKEHKDTVFFTVCNLYGEELSRFEKTFETIEINSFDEVIAKLLLQYANIKIIGFGMPAEDVDGKLVISDYIELKDTQFATYMESKFSVPVFIENDVNAATVGYYRRHLAEQEKIIVGLYFPSKYVPGAGVCINNRLIKGRNGLAGEIQYMPIDVDTTDWGTNHAKVDDIIIRTIKTLMCILNPDLVVLYRENTTEDYCKLLKCVCSSEVERNMIPDIVVSHDMNKDFEAGIISLALERILHKEK